MVKKCDAATVVGLLQEGQVKRDELFLVGVQCAGAWDGDRLADEVPHLRRAGVLSLCDVAVTPRAVRARGGRLRLESGSPGCGDRLTSSRLPPDVTSLGISGRRSSGAASAATPAARSVPCATARAASSEKHRPQWISPAIDETGNTAWNIVRAFHLAGRCTGCDECARACPADIRLDLINRKLARVVEQRFGLPKPGPIPTPLRR